MSYIYKITNQVNNKIYIGKTERDVDLRWKEHCEVAHRRYDRHINNLLARAIRKYGADNFSIETIDVADTVEELNKKEIYWINFYGSYNSMTGYNLTMGGDGFLKYDYNEIDKLLSEGYSNKEISNMIGCSKEYISHYKINHNMSRRKTTKEFEDKVLALLSEGHTVTWIANHFGCSPDKITLIKKNNGIARKRGNLVNYDLLKEKWYEGYTTSQLADYFGVRRDSISKIKKKLNLVGVYNG